MAVMIPDACPPKATQGEKRVYALLRDHLPDDFAVWYEPDVEGRYPDFTLLADTFGILILEVKGWFLNQIARATDREVELLITREGESHKETHSNPFRQARAYMFGVMDLLRREPLLRQVAGSHRGQLCFPCGCSVVFPNITRAQLDQAGLTELFPPSRTLCRDELETWSTTISDSAFIRRLRQCFDPDFPFDPLTPDQMNTVRGAMHREVVLRALPAREESVPPQREPTANARRLEVLDLRQEQAARSLGEGHRIISGVAGSGKTVLLVARAKLLAGRDREKRILFLCYNRTLAAYLRSLFAEESMFRGIEVWPFPGWASQQTGLRWDRDSGEDYEHFEKRLSQTLVPITAQWDDTRKYDAICIDEAQDFHSEWFQACVNVLRNGPQGDLLIAVDGAQSLYGRPRSFTWKSVGIQAAGRSRTLATNYRNTKEILELAWTVTQRFAAEGGSELDAKVTPTGAKRSGSPPCFAACRTVVEEHQTIGRLTRRYLDQGFRPEDIAVLYPRKEAQRIELLRDALGLLGPVCWITRETDPRMKDGFMKQPGIRLSTIHSAKGLQFPVVICSAVDQLPHFSGERDDDDCRLFYVALTRAEEHLAVTWVGRSAFTDRVAASPKAVAWQPEND